MALAPTYDNYVNATKYDLIKSLPVITNNNDIPAGKKPLYMRKFYEYIYGPEGALAKVARNITNELKFTYTLKEPGSAALAFAVVGGARAAGSIEAEIDAINGIRAELYGNRKDVKAWETLYAAGIVGVAAGAGGMPAATTGAIFTANGHFGVAWKRKVTMAVQAGGGGGGGGAVAQGLAAVLPAHPALVAINVLDDFPPPPDFNAEDKPLEDADPIPANDGGPATIERFRVIRDNVIAAAAGGPVPIENYSFYLGNIRIPDTAVNIAAALGTYKNYAKIEDAPAVAAAGGAGGAGAGAAATAKWQLTILPINYIAPGDLTPNFAAGPIVNKSNKITDFAANQNDLALLNDPAGGARAGNVGIAADYTGRAQVIGRSYTILKTELDAAIRAPIPTAITFTSPGNGAVGLRVAATQNDTILCDFQLLNAITNNVTNPAFYGGNALAKPKQTKKQQKKLRRKRRTEKA
jgi:hypothetical protein